MLGRPYSATIVPLTGYSLSGASVTIIMGDTDMTGYYSNGTISIPNVTGDIIITIAAASAVSSITAAFAQGSATIYDTDSLDTLRQYLTVTVSYADSTSATVTDYTLSGTLTAGTSAITVSYGGKTDTFNVTVTHGFLYTATDGLLSAQPYLRINTDDASKFIETYSSTDGTHLYNGKSDGGSYYIYLFDWRYVSNCHASIEFKIDDLSWNGTANTADPGFFRFASYDGDGANGIYIGFSRYGSATAAVKLRTKVAGTVTAQSDVSTSAWHTLTFDIVNGAQTVVLDGTTVISGQGLSTPQSSGADTRIYLGHGTTNNQSVYIRKIEMYST